MKESLLEILRCPVCGARLTLANASHEGAHVVRGELHCGAGHTHPIVDAIPRFVPADNYASSFGLQWNRFRKTQLDSHSGVTISRDRFIRETGWSDLTGVRVLDAGCGAGRFAEVALSLGAELVAIDYSSAVVAAWANLRDRFADRLQILQADIYSLPFEPGSFDRAYSLGVLQHTPDPHHATISIPRFVKSGGEVVVDFYLKHWPNLVHPKYWLRPFTTRMDAQTLFTRVERAVPSLLKVSGAVRKVPLLGRYLGYVIPVADYRGALPLTEEQAREWAVLDTFDWLSPRYDQPQTAETVRAWLNEAGLVNVDVFRSDHLTGRGRKP